MNSVERFQKDYMETCKPGLQCLSSTLYVDESDVCGSCQVSKLNLGSVIFNFRSKRLDGVMVLGCAACFLEDSMREEQDLKPVIFKRQGEPGKVTYFTKI